MHNGHPQGSNKIREENECSERCRRRRQSSPFVFVSFCHLFAMVLVVGDAGVDSLDDRWS